MAHIDWGLLVAQGRAKAYGISWNEEELTALYTHKIPAEYVREGVRTPEAYKEVLKDVEKSLIETKKRPLRYMNRGELLEEAKEKGVEYSPEMTRGDLILAIQGEVKEKEESK